MEGSTIVGEILQELKACSRSGQLEWARRIEASAARAGCQGNSYVVTALIRAYADCGCMASARRTFDSAHSPSLASWNSIILGYARKGESYPALSLFSRMERSSGHAPDSFTYVAALKACASLAAQGERAQALERGREIHLRAGCRLGVHAQATLIDMYARCGAMAEARRAFDALQQPDLVTWNALLRGYAEAGEGKVSLQLFATMPPALAPNAVTYLAALKACTCLAASGEKQDALKRGRAIHSDIPHHLTSHPYLQSALIGMYARCESMPDALRAFHSLCKPTPLATDALLLGYAENGEGLAALDLFARMGNCPVSSATYVGAVKACTCLAAAGRTEEALRRGKEIHIRASAAGKLDLYVCNTLMSMYAKCGAMAEAQRVFDALEKPDVISWTALVLGYADNGQGELALCLFSRMKIAPGCRPNAVTYVAALKACMSLAACRANKEQALRTGKEIHRDAREMADPYVANTAIVMYAKCGSMSDAQQVFDSLQKPDVVSWNALLNGYVENGEAGTALDAFSGMCSSQNCAPDAVTYLAALKACASIAANGDPERALERGKEIHSQIGCRLDSHLQNALIVMYAKCGSLGDAQQVFESLHKPDVVSWNALMQGYAENGEGGVGLGLLRRMRAQGCVPDSVTYAAALKACGLIGALALGRKLHAEMEDELTPHLVTSLVDFYAKCGSMVEACEAYNSHPRARELPALNALLAGCARFGDAAIVLGLFDALQDAGLQPDAVSFVCVLVCSSHAGHVESAEGYMAAMRSQHGIAPDVRHYTCMVDALGRANQLVRAVEVVKAMPCEANEVTWMTLLGACHKWRNAKIGRWAFQSLLLLPSGKQDAAAYVLMGNIYGSCGMREEQERVLKLGRGLRRKGFPSGISV